MRTTLIAATMISGNSGSMGRDAVMSVIEYVDRVVLIDTGASLMRRSRSCGTWQKLRLTLASDSLARAYMVMTQDNSYAKERLIRVSTSLA